MARQLKDSLEVDNYRFIRTELAGNSLIAIIDSESFLSLLHTTEDYLSCLVTAENVITQTQKGLVTKTKIK